MYEDADSISKPGHVTAPPQVAQPVAVTRRPAVSSHAFVDYITELAGILRLVEIAFSFSCLVASGVATAESTGRPSPDVPGDDPATGAHGGAGFFIFVSVTSFVCTLILFILHITKLVEPPKLLIVADLIFCSVWAALYFIASVVVAVNTGPLVGFRAQVVLSLFGFLTLIILTIHSYLLLKKLRQAV